MNKRSALAEQRPAAVALKYEPVSRHKVGVGRAAFVAIVLAVASSFPSVSFADYRNIENTSSLYVSAVQAERILCIRADRGGWKVGTATVLNDRTLLTAYHVVKGCSIVYIGKKSYKVAHEDPSIDLAVLGSGRDFRQLNCMSVPKGRRVSLTGYPEGSNQQVVSQGKTVRDKKSKYSAVEGFAMKGMSGGPVVQENEQLAGIFKAFRGTSRYWYVPGSEICKSLENLKGARLNNEFSVPLHSKNENLLVVENIFPAPSQQTDKPLEKVTPKPTPGPLPAQTRPVQSELLSSPAVFQAIAAVVPKTIPQVQFVMLPSEQEKGSVPNSARSQKSKMVSVSKPMKNYSKQRALTIDVVVQSTIISNPREQRLPQTLSVLPAAVRNKAVAKDFGNQDVENKLVLNKINQAPERGFSNINTKDQANSIKLMVAMDMQKDQTPVNVLAKNNVRENRSRLVGMTLFGQPEGVKIARLGQDTHFFLPKTGLTSNQLQLANMMSFNDNSIVTDTLSVEVESRELTPTPQIWGLYWVQLMLAMFLGFTFGGSFMLWGGRLSRILSQNRV